MTNINDINAVLASEHIPVSDRNAKRKHLLGGVAMLGICAVMCFFIFSTPDAKHKHVKMPDEEFKTTTFHPPSFVRPPDEVAQVPPQPDTLQLPVTPPPEKKSDTTEFQVPPPPIQVVDVPPPPSSLKAEEQVDEFPSRFRSKMVQFDGAGTAGSGNALGGSDANGSPRVAGTDQNSKYLANAASMAPRSAKASKIERLDAVIPEGTLIPGLLETAIVSDLPGQIRAITSEDVYSFDGRRILIPTGTRLIGDYQSDIMTGQTRIFVVWTRLIRDDGISIPLASIGTDSLGRSGLTGTVDNKWRQRFGSAMVLSIVGAGASYATGSGSHSNSDSDASQLARQTLAQSFSDMANQALSKNINIPPTISVSRGAPINIFVRQDLDFSAYYPDPVTEAMEEIRRERRTH